MNIFRRETIGEFTVITLDIQSIDAGNSQSAGKLVLSAMSGNGRNIVDLGALRYFDVAGFATILRWAGGGPQQAEVRFCSRAGTIWALFELLRARAVVPLYRNREEAMASFGRTERRTAAVIPLREEQEETIPEQRIA